MKKKISAFLSRHVRRLRIFYFLIIVIFFASTVFFYYKTKELDEFINDLSKAKTEWSPSEHNAFLSMLVTELNRNTTEDEKRQKERYEKIKGLLMPIKTKIEGIKSVDEEIENPGVINIDKLDPKDVPGYLNDEQLEGLSLNELNLVLEEKTPDIRKYEEGENAAENSKIRYFILRNGRDVSFNPRSFLFVPTQLVNVEDEKSNPQLTLKLKRELVFSKAVEKYLSDILKQIPQEYRARQSYFITLSGFVRLFPNPEKNKNFIEYYNKNLSYKQNFADRTYFDKTLEEKFHQSPLYVDTGGFGIVQTYSASILNHHLGIMGIIAIDITIEESIKPLLEKSTFGSSGFVFKTFLIDFCNRSGRCKKTQNRHLLESEKEQIFKSKTSTELFTRIHRFDFDAKGQLIKPVHIDPNQEGRIIFSVPVSEEKVAFVIFDKERLKRHRFIFLLAIAFLLLGITLLIFFVYNQSIKRIQEEEKKLELISHMHNSYVITGKNNRILNCNKEFENLVEDKNLVGNNLEMYLAKDSVKDFKFYIDSEKERFECPVDLETKTGRKKTSILINTKIDYQADKKARISILIESESLESAVAEKYADKISHLLKSPLHSILQIADQLRRKTAQPRYNDYFLLLNNETKGLRNEISRILSISKLEYKTLEPEYEKVDLTKLVNDIKNEFIPLMEKRKLGFNSNLAGKVTLFADRNMIKTSIENILDNALKYTPNGSISFFLFDAKDKAKIVISDTGIGIPENEIDSIFKKNTRSLHPVVQKCDGQGFGLYQTMNFIKLHGGQIHVKSAVKKGTEFTISLPKNSKESKGE
ncbi:MAG: HAMP domain-containing histidine kinase [Candidatus Aminicenantes bacterium]|nr:MAG: HAMP domain-containing histidine kinase [Candidatus Aminicenantes bacterium]